MELSQSLKDLAQLRNVNLQLYSNFIEARSAAKIAKRLSLATKLTNAVVNLNFNDKLRLDGAREIVSTFRQTKQLINLELLLTKVGVDKENGISLKDDLNRNKLGSPFERVVVLFWAWISIELCFYLKSASTLITFSGIEGVDFFSSSSRGKFISEDGEIHILSIKKQSSKCSFVFLLWS